MLKVLYVLDILTICHHINCVVYITSYATACLAPICSIIGSVVGKHKLFTSRQYMTISAISKDFCPGNVWCWFTICSAGQAYCWATFQHNLVRSAWYQWRWVYNRNVSHKIFTMSKSIVKGVKCYFADCSTHYIVVCVMWAFRFPPSIIVCLVLGLRDRTAILNVVYNHITEK